MGTGEGKENRSQNGIPLQPRIGHDAMSVRVCLLCLAIALMSAPALGQTLEEEVVELLTTHPRLKAAGQNIAASEEGISGAFAEYLPKVRAFGDFGYERIDSPARRTSAFGEEFTTGGARQASVTVTETLFNGFLNDSINETAQLNRVAAEIDLTDRRQGIIFEGADVYLLVLRNTRLIELALTNEDRIGRVLELENERVRRGSGITLDVLESKSRLQLAKERVVAFKGALRDSLSRYIQVFNHGASVSDMTMPTPPLGSLPDSLDDAIEIALSEHPAVADSDTSVDLAFERRRVAKSRYFPSIDLVGSWNYEKDLDGIDSSRRDYKIKLQANWDLFTGFANRAAVAENAHRYLASIDDSNFARRGVVEEVRLAWHRLNTARARVTLLQNAVNIAREVFDAKKKRREAGRETVKDVLDAEIEQFTAQINMVAAEHDARVAVYRVLRSIGRLNLESVSGFAAS